MNKELYELEVIVPNWYAKDFDNIKEYNKATIIKFGIVMGNKNDIVELFMNFSNNKQELFNDYKEFKENITNNTMKQSLNEIDIDTYLKNEKLYINKVNNKYKLSIEKLITIFFKEPLKNKYEYNLVRDIPQNFINFIKLNAVWFSLGTKEKHYNIETKHLVYEFSEFEFTKECIRITPYSLNFIDLSKI